jgi:hypothetical protein
MLCSSPFANQNDKEWGAHHEEGSTSAGQDRGAMDRAGRQQRGMQWRWGISVEGGGNAAASASREAAMAWHRGRREWKFGPPDGTKYFLTGARVLRQGGGYSFYTRDSIGIAQPIWKMRFIILADVSRLIPIIFCIDWLTSADTNKAQPINKLPAHHCPDWAPQWWWWLFQLRATVPTEIISLFWGIFLTFSNMFLPLFAMVYILIDLWLFPCIYSNIDFDFNIISLIDPGLFPCIYSKDCSHVYILIEI